LQAIKNKTTTMHSAAKKVKIFVFMVAYNWPLI